MIHIATNLLACVTCTGSRGEALDKASSGAIVFMLILLVAVFGGVFQFMRYLSKCERVAIRDATKK
jgi:hypothetical protein